MWSEVVISTGVTIVVLVLVGVMVLYRRGLSQKGTNAMALAVAQGEHIPPSLHPIIDANLCIGSFSCIKACPEGDIIRVIDGIAQLVEAAHCIGHSRCYVECPVGAIRLVFGTAERGIDLPETSESFESSRPGVFVVGELGGMGLIKNALRQGLEVAEVLAKKLKAKNAAGADDVDVAVVGGGPAGVATAVALKKLGLRACVLEQESLGGCIAHYPRGKVVMSEMVDLPYYGKFGRSLLSKEELLEQLEAVLEKSGVTIDEGEKVTSVDGEPGNFTVHTARGRQVRAQSVVLATGLRGSPRKLGVPGEDKNKVMYRLIDPEQFHGKRVLVVGGGDSAIEAAIQLAEESTAKVSISYRQDKFSRAKSRNRDKIAALVAENRVRALMSTEVSSIDDDVVHLRTNEDKEGVLKNDVVIVAVGGELPTGFLKNVGVEIRRYTGQEKGDPSQAASAEPNAGQKLDLVSKIVPRRGATGQMTKAEKESQTRRRLAIFLFAMGSFIMTSLFLVGQEYYLLDPDGRRENAMHELLKPAGLWGHNVGIIATVFMLATLIYPLRKRWSLLKGASTIRSWLTFHMFAGVMSPLIVAFHAAFLMNNLLAVWTWIALAIVVGTGVFGRFLFGFVPAQAGKVLELSEIRRNLSVLEKQLSSFFDQTTNAEAVRELFRRANEPPAPAGFATLVWRTFHERRQLSREIETLAPYFPDRHVFQSFGDGVLAVARARVHERFYALLKGFFRTWLVVHVVLALFMVVLITAHITVALWLGFAPIGGG